MIDAMSRMARCRDCGRPAEGMSRCPWCGSDVPPGLTAWAVFSALAAGAVCAALAFRADALTLSKPAFFAISALCGIAVAFPMGSVNWRGAFSAACTAVAVSGLCHVAPGLTGELAARIRFHAAWAVPCAVLAAVAARYGSGPIPAATWYARLARSLKNPAAALLAAVVSAAALMAPANAASMLALALCVPALTAALGASSAMGMAAMSALLAFAAVIPSTAGWDADAATRVFAVAATLAAAAQCVPGGMKRPEKVSPSSQP